MSNPEPNLENKAPLKKDGVFLTRGEEKKDTIQTEKNEKPETMEKPTQEKPQTMQNNPETGQKPLNPMRENVVNIAVEAMQQSEEVGKITKGEILKKAGYSETMQNSPGRVLDDPQVKAAIKARAKEVGIPVNFGQKHLKKLGQPKSLRVVYFPSESDSCVSDEEVRESFKKKGLDVQFITPTKAGSRGIWYWHISDYAHREAAHLAFELTGAYAPKKVEGKHMVASSSLSDLRKWRKENNEKPI